MSFFPSLFSSSTPNNSINSNNSNDLDNPDYLFKILIVGDPRVGKSSLLERYCSNIFNQNLFSTTGIDFKIKDVKVKNKFIKVQLWDISSGTAKFRALNEAYFRYTKAIIFTYDITDLYSFERIKTQWYELFKKHSNTISDNLDPIIAASYDIVNYNAPILILGCKADLRTTNNYRTCVNSDVAREFAQSIGGIFFESSSKDSLNINESFQELLEQTLFEYTKSYGKSLEEIHRLKSQENQFKDFFKLTPLKNKPTNCVDNNKTILNCNIQ